MIKSIIVFLLILFGNVCLGQTFQLGPERIQKIKNSTIKIIVNGGQSTGTGFFINELGLLVTCWHVIAGAVNNPSSKFEAQLLDGSRIPIGLPNALNNEESINKMIMYDFIIMMPVSKLPNKTSFLQLGNWEDAKEGALTYTSGYPLGIDQQVVSVGILSTKFVQKDTMTYSNGKPRLPFSKDAAWLDLRMNRGNSGGAVLLIGNSPSEDRVIGFADFILNPFANESEKLLFQIREAQKMGSALIMGIDPNKSAALFATAVSHTSLGVSGCLSINYVTDLLNQTK